MFCIHLLDDFMNVILCLTIVGELSTSSLVLSSSGEGSVRFPHPF